MENHFTYYNFLQIPIFCRFSIVFLRFFVEKWFPGLPHNLHVEFLTVQQVARLRGAYSLKTRFSGFNLKYAWSSILPV